MRIMQDVFMGDECLINAFSLGKHPIHLGLCLVAF